MPACFLGPYRANASILSDVVTTTPQTWHAKNWWNQDKFVCWVNCTLYKNEYANVNLQLLKRSYKLQGVYLGTKKNKGKKLFHRVLDLVNELYHGNFIDEMTKKCLCQTPTPPRIPVFYTLTNSPVDIHFWISDDVTENGFWVPQRRINIQIVFAALTF